jgi:hypothetical protein
MHLHKFVDESLHYRNKQSVLPFWYHTYPRCANFRHGIAVLQVLRGFRSEMNVRKLDDALSTLAGFRFKPPRVQRDPWV